MTSLLGKVGVGEVKSGGRVREVKLRQSAECKSYERLGKDGAKIKLDVMSCNDGYVEAQSWERRRWME